jgi:hypothetical protein
VGRAEESRKVTKILGKRDQKTTPNVRESFREFGLQK